MAFPLLFRKERSVNTPRRRKLLEHLSDFEIIQNCGVKKEGVEALFSQLEICFEGQRSSSLPVETKMLTYLSFLRSGSFQWMVGGSSGAAQSTVSKIIEDGTNQIIRRAKTWIKFPQTQAERNVCIENFYQIAHFPKVVGCVDGTHVAIKGPSQDEAIYVNRKMFHSINVQVVANYNYQFHDVIAKWPGSSHDSFIWRNSSTKSRLENGLIGDSWLLGDSGYPQEQHLMTPYSNSALEDASRRRYNKAHSSTRSLVERTIGNWKSRFRVMDKTGGTLSYTSEKSCRLIVASCALHNLLCKLGIELEVNDEFYRDNEVIPAMRDFPNQIFNQNPQEEYGRNRIVAAFN